MKKEKEKSKILIFDFDGTIADTKSIYYNSICSQLKSLGFSCKKIEKVIDAGLSLKNVLRKLGFSFRASWYIKKKIMKDVLSGINNIKKCKDIDSIRKLDCRKIIVSNSLKEFIIPLLKHLRIEKDFNEIYGAEDFSDKAEFISAYLKKNKIRKKDCYYIADRKADAQLARKTGIISVIVLGKCAWDSRKEILKENPDFVIDDLAEISEIIT